MYFYFYLNQISHGDTQCILSEKFINLITHCQTIQIKERKKMNSLVNVISIEQNSFTNYF